jgi:hypothetical protein
MLLSLAVVPSKQPDIPRIQISSPSARVSARRTALSWATTAMILRIIGVLTVPYGRDA